MDQADRDFIVIVHTATTAQAVSENIIGMSDCLHVQGSVNTGVSAILTPVTGSPGTTQVQFAGSPATPTTGFTLNSAPAVGDYYLIKATPYRGNPIGY